MMKGDDRDDGAPAKILQHAAVAIESRLIEATRYGFDAAPFDGKAQGVHPDLLGQVEVALGVGPPVASLAAGIPRLDAAGALPLEPLIIFVAAFDLVGGGGDAPQEVIREMAQ